MAGPVAGDGLAAAWRRAAAEPGVVVLDGFHPVKHALRFGAEVVLAVTTDLAGTLTLAAAVAPELTDLLAATLHPVDAAVLARLVPPGHPTGVAALARRPDRPLDTLLANPGPAPVVLLENPRNLGNVGAVIRVAAGIGAGGVITTGTVDPWHPQVLRGSAGLHFALPVNRAEAVPAGPRPVLALDPGGVDLRSGGIPDRALLVFGSERSGISPATRDRADALIALPIRPGVSSYNLATAVAMALYEWARSAVPTGN